MPVSRTTKCYAQIAAEGSQRQCNRQGLYRCEILDTTDTTRFFCSEHIDKARKQNNHIITTKTRKDVRENIMKVIVEITKTSTRTVKLYIEGKHELEIREKTMELAKTVNFYGAPEDTVKYRIVDFEIMPS